MSDELTDAKASNVAQMLYTLELYDTTASTTEAAFYDHKSGQVRTFEVPPHMVAQIPGYLRMMEQMDRMK